MAKTIARCRGSGSRHGKEEPLLHELIILGSGPAGYTAALYAARANLKPLVIEGHEPGGQLTMTTVIENFPGFPEGIDGNELMQRMRQQAERFGAAYRYGSATAVDLSGPTFSVTVDDDEQVRCQALIIATGASAKLLGLENERKLMGRGVSTCATCDGAFFPDKKLVIVGGGDSALEEATFLTRFARQVTVVHRRDELRASKIMSERARQNPKIDFIWNATVADILGAEAGKVQGVRLQNVQTGELFDHECDGVFIAIGHQPNTGFLRDWLEMNETGYLITKPGSTATNVPGVFAAGDVADPHYRQAITAAGSGCQAALDAERHLEGSARHDWSQ